MKKLVDHLTESIEQAGNNTRITNVQIEGMTSNLVRGLLNNLVAAPWASYLEVGVWKGATFISALSGNSPAYAVGIDNFSQFGSPRTDFLLNLLGQYDCLLPQITFIDHDCWTVDKSLIKNPINIYFYDGDHSQESHAKALTHFADVLDDSFIYICDDWNFEYVGSGTALGIHRARLKLNHFESLPARYNGDKEQWWNGIGAMVLSK